MCVNNTKAALTLLEDNVCAAHKRISLIYARLNRGVSIYLEMWERKLGLCCFRFSEVAQWLRFCTVCRVLELCFQESAARYV